MNCLKCNYLQRSVSIIQNEKDSWVTTQTEYNCTVRSDNFNMNLQQSLEGGKWTPCNDGLKEEETICHQMKYYLTVDHYGSLKMET